MMSFFRLVVILLTWQSSKAHHLLENAKLYQEKLATVQEIASFVCVKLHLDLVKLYNESQLLANGSQTLRRMCEQLVTVDMYELCEKILNSDLPSYTKLTLKVMLIHTMTTSTSEQTYRSSTQLNDLEIYHYKETVMLHDHNPHRLEQFLSNLTKISNEVYNQQRDIMYIISNVNVLNGILQDLAQTVTRKLKAVNLLLTTSTNRFHIKSFESLLALSERKQLLSVVANHASKFNNTVKVNITSLFNILQIAHYERFVSDNHISVKVRIPLVTNNKYTALKVTVLPAMYDDLLMFPFTHNDIIFIGENNRFVTTLNYSNYRNICKTLANTVICEFPHGKQTRDVTTSLKYNCLHSLVFVQQTKPCRTSIMRNKWNIWLATQNPNIWLYIFPRKESVVLTLDGKQTFKHLFGSGLLKLVPKMTVQSEDFVMQYKDTGYPEELGRFGMLRVNVSYRTMNIVQKLNISQTHLNSRVLMTEGEKHSFFASGISENLLIQAWEMKEGHIVEDPNTALYNMLTVSALFILLLCIVTVSMCEVSKKYPNSHIDTSVQANIAARYEVTQNKILLDKQSFEATKESSV